MRYLSFVSFAALTFLLQGCATQSGASTASNQTTLAPQPTPWSEPGNIGKAKIAANAYVKSGEYMRDVAAVDSAAASWVHERAPQVQHPALVFDIDETSLSNMAAMTANDWAYIPAGDCDHLPKGPCGFTAWEEKAQAPAIAPTLELIRSAQAEGVTIFFVTGRPESQRAITEQNLTRAGYTGWKGLYLEPANTHFSSAIDYKAPTRSKIEAQGYTIIATLGDQYSDLNGGHAERGFKLPNPFYYLP